jgi:hypothetical protein
MTSIRVTAGSFFTVGLLMAAGVWSAGSTTWRLFDTGPLPVQRTTPTSSLDRDPRLDVYGNPIEPAVNEYRLDWRGALYERNTPDTEIARLGDPEA